jgi:hypothetical protein
MYQMERRIDSVRTIGERAAHLIRVRATMKGISIDQECERIGANRKVYRDWRKCGRNPTSYFLQQMALAGYDVIWILTGKESLNEN